MHSCPPPVAVAPPVTAAPGPFTTARPPPAPLPAPQCGDLPSLTHAVWIADSLLEYQCEEGFSFTGNHVAQVVREVECLPDGSHSPVRSCLPIDDCLGHTCGAFGSCSDLHMNYTCQRLDGYEFTEVEGSGEKSVATLTTARAILARRAASVLRVSRTTLATATKFGSKL